MSRLTELLEDGRLAAAPDSIFTFTGGFIRPLDPDPEDICIEDIAHALSMQCRWTGHVSKFYCPTEDQRILTADLRWRPAGDLSVGDELLGFDEEPHELGQAGKRRRRFRPSRIVVMKPVRRHVVRLEMADGSTVRSSAEHPWLIATKKSRNQKWATSTEIAAALAAGRKRYMHRFMPTWEDPSSWRHGWLAGMFDGEGYLSYIRRGTMLGVSQNPGLILDRLASLIEELGYGACRCSHTGSGDGMTLTVRGGWRAIAHLLGSTRPVRLLDKFTSALRDGEFDKQMNGVGEPSEIVGAYDEGDEWVTGIETTTHTYLCEGYAAHNSVAEHSLHVAALVPSAMSMAALLHDATEAYLADLARPIKQAPGLGEVYLKVEARLAEAIGFTFGIPSSPLSIPEIKTVDERMLWAEAKVLLPKLGEMMPDPGFDCPRPQCWTPEEAEVIFLETFDEYLDIQKVT